MNSFKIILIKPEIYVCLSHFLLSNSSGSFQSDYESSFLSPLAIFYYFSSEFCSAFFSWSLLRKIGKNADARLVIVNIVIGMGSESSDTSGETTAESLANMLQMPKADAASTVGNIYGVAT